MADEKKVVLLNRGKRSFQLAGKRVAPGEMVEVSEAVAAKLNYAHLVDVSKLPIKGGDTAAKLAKDNAELLKKNAELQKQLDDAAAKSKADKSDKGDKK